MDTYLWLKALHVISMIAWMAGLMYLPRLFVYHAGEQAGSKTAATFEIMERRLLMIIMTPAMIFTWIFGFILAAKIHAFAQPWFHVKLTLVIALTIFHFVLASWRKKLATGQNTKSERFFRLVNEVPTVLMIIIVILVIVKPF